MDFKGTDPESGERKRRRTGVRKLLRTSLVLARVWRGQAVGIVPTETLKLRRQMEAAAGKKESVFGITLY